MKQDFFVTVLAIVFLLLLAVPAMAGNVVTLTWEYPTDEEAKISGFSVYMRADDGEYAESVVTPGADERTAEITGIEDGTYWFCLTATTALYGTESSRSEEAGITFNAGEVSYPFTATTPTILSIQGTVVE